MKLLTIKQKEFFKIILVAVSVLLVNCVVFNRLKYGVDFTDESAYLTWAYRYSLGDNFLLDTSEELQSIGSIFIAPFMKLYHYFSSGYEGVFYWFRILYYVFTLLVYFIIVWSLNCNQKWLINWLTALPVLILALGNIYQFSYNTISLNLTYVSLYLLFAIKEDKGRNKAILALAGGLMGLSTIIYPSFVLLFLSVGVNYYCIFKRIVGKAQAKKYSFILIISGGTTVLLIFFLTMNQSGWNIEGMYSGITAIMEQIKLKNHLPIAQRLNKISFDFKLYLTSHQFQIIFLYTVVCEAIHKVFKTDKRKMSGILYLVFNILILKGFSNSDGTQIHYIYTSFIFANTYFILFCCSSSEYKSKILLGALIPCFSIVIIRCITSDNNSLTYQMQTGLVMLFPIFGLWLKEKEPMRNDWLALSIMITLCFTYIFMSYKSFYRETSYETLSMKVDNGIYKNLYTSKEKWQAIEKIQKELLLNLERNSKNTIMVANHFVPLYMMSGLRPVTPDIWDAMGTNRGNKGCHTVLNYFDRVEQTPDYIVFESYEGNKYWYSDDTFDFHEYMKNRYYLIYESIYDGSEYRMAIYKKKS